MKAIVCLKYGPPDVLQLQEVPKPAPKDHEILVKIHAAAATSGDARVRGLNVPFGFGLMTRAIFGFTKPRNPIFGMDFAGEVESVGQNVSSFKIGDRVFGSSDAFGAYAEYLTISEEKAVTQMPAHLGYEEAAAIPFGATASLVYLRDLGKIDRGQTILINGASGSLGTAAVQLGKYFGAEVTGVCSTSNMEMVKELGADTVIDYTKENFTDRDENYNIIFDTVGKTSFSACKGSLKTEGRFLMAVAGIPQFLKVLWTSMASRKKAVAGVAIATKEDINVVKEMVDTGELQPVIDRSYPLEKTAEAHEYIDRGHKKGNVVINIHS